jgi:HSP20 family protein
MSWDDNFDDDEARKKIRRWFGDFLPEDMFRQIESMIDRMLDDLGEGGFIDSRSLEEFMRDPQGTNPFVFGFSMTMGPDGKPTIRRFGNVSPDESGIKMTPQLEPLVDVIDEDEEIIVVAELPGVSSDEIKVRVKGGTLTIHADNPARPYHKEISLPSKVKKEDASSAIRNGILEVRLKKA